MSPQSTGAYYIVVTYHQYYQVIHNFYYSDYFTVHSQLFSQMLSPRKHSAKYNKVNQQKKFHLLTLIYKQRFSIKEAAQTVGINYLTAKTIVFFHKNNYKSYQFDLNPHSQSSSPTTASFLPVRKINPINEKLIKPKSRIQVICSIGNVLSPCNPNSYPEGELTGQFASKNEALLDHPQGPKIPSHEKKVLEWKFAPFVPRDSYPQTYDFKEERRYLEGAILG